MRKKLTAVSGLMLTALLTGCCHPSNSASLPVPLHGQLQTNWCWAASGQMTMNYLHPASNVRQCDEANKRFGRNDCCNQSVPSACNNGGWPEYQKYNFTADTTSDAPLSWATIQSQIYCSKKPFAFSWHWNTGGGHMMVATGYSTVDGVNYVNVNNPWPPTGGVMEIDTYDNYVGGSGWDHSHWNDYYNITYAGGQ